LHYRAGLACHVAKGRSNRDESPAPDSQTDSSVAKGGSQVKPAKQQLSADMTYMQQMDAKENPL
jgi:hypothetical protein